MSPVFRFAPSPNGALHLGHALSALINFEAAKHTNGRFLVRIEDIDTVRCTKDKTDQVLDDLKWLGLEWETPVLRQSQRFPLYQEAIKKLQRQKLIYPSIASRKDIQQTVANWETSNHQHFPRDPNGASHFPRALLLDKEKDNGDHNIAWRLNMKKALAEYSAPLSWFESGPRSPSHPASEAIPATPKEWGDVILSRKDTPTSYHLSVVIDDAAQGITHVVRGQDLYHATSLHRLLQVILDLPAPFYHHHRLLTDVQGQKLSKSRGDLSLAALRSQGVTPQDIRNLIRWSDDDLSAFAKGPSGP